MKNNEMVVPGEKLAAEEEYAHGSNTYVEDGMVYASLIGRVSIQNGTIGVSPAGRDLREIERGMAVLGNVSDYMKSVIFVKLDNIKTQGKEFLALKDGKILIPKPRSSFDRDRRGPGRRDSHDDRGARGDRRGSDHRDRDRGPREAEEKQCKVGDTVLATVAFVDKDAYTLDMRAPEAGVVYSSCELCGGEMVQAGAGVLECTQCKHKEHRKVSSLYGKPDELSKIFA